MYQLPIGPIRDVAHTACAGFGAYVFGPRFYGSPWAQRTSHDLAARGLPSDALGWGSIL